MPYIQAKISIKNLGIGMKISNDWESSFAASFCGGGLLRRRCTTKRTTAADARVEKIRENDFHDRCMRGVAWWARAAMCVTCQLKESRKWEKVGFRVLQKLQPCCCIYKVRITIVHTIGLMQRDRSIRVHQTEGSSWDGFYPSQCERMSQAHF